MTRTFVNAT